MDTGQPLFIVNPQSGGGRTRKRWPTVVVDALLRAGIEPQAVFTAHRGDGVHLAANAIAEGYETLIAVGGDGTINEVATAILEAGAGDRVRLGTIGMGTGKDIAKCLGIGRGADAVRAIVRGQERRIDAGRIETTGPGGETQTRYFLLAASAGWVPEISASTPTFLKRLGDTAPYLITTAWKLLGSMNRHFEVAIDGERFDGPYNSISVHNMELWGGDLVAVPGALPDDGLFDVVRWGALPRRAVLTSVQGQREGKGAHLEMAGVDHHQARTVQVTSARPSLVDLDGERGGYLPASITMLPGALRFLAPPR